MGKCLSYASLAFYKKLTSAQLQQSEKKMLV